jgi:hypothetical protein
MPESPFSLNYRSKPIIVEEGFINDQRVFKITFCDGTKPLMLTVGTNQTGNRFWVSVPPKRMQEACEIGPLIARYFRDKKNRENGSA